MIYKHTIVENNPHAVELAAAVAAAWPALTWRHHGIGVLQAYLREGNNEIRVHVWHPKLLVYGLEDSGQIHDHHFVLKSHVLVGAIEHSEVELQEAPQGGWRIWTVQNARKGAEPPQLASLNRFGTTITTSSIAAGQTYFFPAKQFHLSRVAALAVTIVAKLAPTPCRARILVPFGVVPVHGFTHEQNINERADILVEAQQSLLEM
jgi:hypothetical protein